jgi:hypothetical protein
MGDWTRQCRTPHTKSKLERINVNQHRLSHDLRYANQAASILCGDLALKSWCSLISSKYSPTVEVRIQMLVTAQQANQVHKWRKNSIMHCIKPWPVRVSTARPRTHSSSPIATAAMARAARAKRLPLLLPLLGAARLPFPLASALALHS